MSKENSMKTLREMMDLVEGAQRSYGGGDDNAGGYSYHTTGDDGTDQSVYVPGKYDPSPGLSRHDVKPEPRHPLQGKIVSAQYGDGTVSGKLIGTEQQGSVAKIKDPETGAIYYVDADSVNRNLDETEDPLKKIDELFKDR